MTKHGFSWHRGRNNPQRYLLKCHDCSFIDSGEIPLPTLVTVESCGKIWEELDHDCFE